jgi:DeoR/GlpR family transcriptional regulator of sugar metabolism
MSWQPEPIPAAKVRHVSIRTAEAYAGKTDKTVQRDLNELEQMGLIRKSAKGVWANIELILAFLPPVRVEGMSQSLKKEIRESGLEDRS